MKNDSQILGFRLAALFGPAIAVGFFQIVMDEPSSVRAESNSAEFIPLPSVPEQSFDTTSTFDHEVAIASPFHYEKTEMAFPKLPQVPFPQGGKVNDADPLFTLTTVFPSTHKSYAVINGKPHAEGQEVSDGWTLIKISGQDRYVILKHASGRRLRVMMSQQ